MNQLKKVNNINNTDTSDLVKKTNFKTIINEIKKTITDHNHDKYITTQESAESFSFQVNSRKFYSKI